MGVFYLILVINYLCSSINCANNYTEVCSSFINIVDCSQRKLKDVPLNIPTWTAHLNLNNNHIQSFKSDAFQNLTDLAELKLNKNKINVIPKGAFDSLKKLKVLEISRNELKDIEALTFKSSGKLTALRLRTNRISQLKDGAFFGLTKLKFLALDYNSIQVIAKQWLYGLSNLKQLTISHNMISDIYAGAWEVCKDLIHLDLSSNQIQAIQKDTFKHLSNLQSLHLSSNNITFIKEGAFEHIQSLTVLLLDDNRISWAIEDSDAVFSSLNNLFKLYLANNNIKSINKNALRGLDNVAYLDLSDNNVITVEENAFSEMPALKELILNTSALLCDCNLKWFYEWLRPKKFHMETNCWYPEPLRNISLMEVEASNFTCDDIPKPRLTEEPDLEIMALKDENISLTCKAISSADSPMNFTWKKDKVELINADVNVVATTYDAKNTESTSVLKLYKVKNSDAGKYQCIVSNDFGSTYSQTSDISVLIFPTFVKIPQNITVRPGSTAKFQCAAYGEPLPEIAWQKDGGIDFPAARERRMHVMPTDDMFFIVHAKPRDIGIYSCMANNAAGTIIANASLMMEEMPSFMKPMENKEITAGEPVILQCTASGIPKPTIQWLKDDGPIHPTERHFFTAEDQLMIIVDTVVSDTGTYQCKLNNSLGSIIEFSEVIVKPDLSGDNLVKAIIIISVVCCTILASVIWIIVLYHTRRRSTKSADVIDKALTQFADNCSEHSSSDTGNCRHIRDRNNTPPSDQDDVSNLTNNRHPTFVESLDRVDEFAV